jgi:hypothetical protein
MNQNHMIPASNGLGELSILNFLQGARRAAALQHEFKKAFMSAF